MHFQRGGTSVKGELLSCGTTPGLTRRIEPTSWAACFSRTFLNHSNCTNPVPKALKSLCNFECVTLPLWVSTVMSVKYDYIEPDITFDPLNPRSLNYSTHFTALIPLSNNT